MHKALALVQKDRFRENREQSTPTAVIVLRGNAQMGLAANANEERVEVGKWTRCGKEGDKSLRSECRSWGWQWMPKQSRRLLQLPHTSSAADSP